MIAPLATAMERALSEPRMRAVLADLQLLGDRRRALHFAGDDCVPARIRLPSVPPSDNVSAPRTSPSPMHAAADHQIAVAFQVAGELEPAPMNVGLLDTRSARRRRAYRP